MRGIKWVLSLLLVLAAAAPVPAFQKDGCGSGECSSCHTLTRDEAEEILGGLVHKVLSVGPSEVPGLWVAEVESKKKQRVPVYIDFSKRYVISGNILDAKTRENVTRRRVIQMNRIDPSVIPLDDAIVIGDPSAGQKIVVFTDPECPYCRKLHPELSKAVERRPGLAFYVKIFPLPKSSRAKALTLVCTRSPELLDAAMAGRPLPEAECETDQLDRNVELGRSIGVRSTPTLVFPDGRVIPGAKTADRILLLLDEGSPPAAPGPGAKR